MTNGQTGAQGSAIGAGLLSGSVAAVAASLLQLPLHAPTDTLFNSGTVTAGAMLTGLTSGILWRILGRGPARRRLYFAAWAAGFGVVVLLAFQAASQLDRSVSYIVPVAAVVFAAVAVLTPLLAGSRASARWWLALLAVAFAAGVGAGLAGVGDQESGRLELPARSSTEIDAHGPEHSVAQVIRLKRS